MTRATTLFLAALLSLAFLPGQLIRPSSAAAMTPPAGKRDHAMAAMLESGTPGQHHKHPELLVGAWEVAHFWTLVPEAPPTTPPAESREVPLVPGS